MSSAGTAGPVTAAFPTRGEAGGVVATSGIVALEPGTLRPACADFDGQARQVLSLLDLVLAAADARPLRLLRVECFLADRCWYPRWDAIFAEHYGAAAPARTTLVCGLALEGLLIEVQGLAVREERC